MAQLLRETHIAYRFVVRLDRDPIGVFTECDLPVLEWETEEVPIGGTNTHVAILPGRRKAGRLTLKHGIGKGELVDWYCKALENKFVPRIVTVELLDVLGKGVVTWTMQDCYPVKWSGPQLKTDSNAVAIQSIEFVCGLIKVEFSS